MKHLFIGVLLLLSLNISAQPENAIPEKLEYDGFVDLSDMDGATIYETAKNFFIQEYNHGSTPLKMNRNRGKIIGNNRNAFKLKTRRISRPCNTILSYQITMNIGDNGYLIELSDFHFIIDTKQVISGNVYQEDSPNSDKQKKIEALLIPLAKQASEQVQKDVHAIMLNYVRNSIAQSIE